MEQREVQVRVVDHETYPGNKTSKSIRRKEYSKLYPDQTRSQVHFIFTHKMESLMPEKQAKFLIRKYGKVIEIVGAEGIKLNKDEKMKYNVDQLKRGSMINLAARMSIKNAITMKNEVLRETIKKAILEGVEPITQEAFELRKGK